MKEIHVVGAAILKDNKVLAAQRSIKMKEPLKWEFPGGKVEVGETHQQALIREIYEELGVKISVGSLIASGSSQVNDKKIVLYVYRAEIAEGLPCASEHAQLRWLDINSVKGLDWAKADIPACIELIRLHSDE